jgi:hypothetical protein
MLIVLALHVALAFQDPVPIDATVVRKAVAEAAAIWVPYGFALDTADGCGRSAAETLLLTIGIAGTAMPGRPPIVLGAIVFGPDGTPKPRITLFLDEALRFVAGARVLRAEEWQWPRLLREQILGRILGRVLAHEVGHYVLGDRRHTGAGLMRSIQRSDELAAPSRAGFTLSAGQASQLRARSVAVSGVEGTRERAGTCGRP